MSAEHGGRPGTAACGAGPLVREETLDQPAYAAAGVTPPTAPARKHALVGAT